MGTAIGIYSVLEYVEHKKIKVSLILYFIFLLEIIFATATRGKIVYFAGIIVIALLDKYENNLKGLIKENKKIIIFLAIMFLIVFIVTLQRNLSGGGFLYNIYAYFIGSIHLLGQYLKQPETYLLTSQNYLYGQVLISGFVYPITFIMRLFGMKIMAGIYIVNEVTQKYIPVSNVTTMNNNVTFLYSALRDFGVLGLIIYPMILAFFLMKFYNKKEKEKTLYSKAMYDFFLINAIFLLFDFKFSDPSTIWTFLFIYIFYKLTPNKIKEIKSKMIEITKLREKK